MANAFVQGQTRAVRLGGGVALLLAVLALPTTAASEVSDLEASVREWLQLRREVYAVQAEWKEQEDLLGHELQLLQRRKGQLAQQLAEQAAANRDGLASVKQLLARKRVLQDALAELTRAVGAAEAHLRTWPERLPLLLREPLEEAFARLPRDATADMDHLAGRLRLVLDLYGRLHELAGGVHTGRMVLATPDGGRREAEVLFLGLAAGYALSTDGAHAAIGRPVPDGWSWEWDTAPAADVQRLLAVHRRERAASLVTVPVRTGGPAP